MSKPLNKEKRKRSFFVLKSVVSKKGATLRVTKLELTQNASEQLKADSRGIRVGADQQEDKELLL